MADELNKIINTPTVAQTAEQAAAPQPKPSAPRKRTRPAAANDTASGEEAQAAAPSKEGGVMLFGKYDVASVKVNDLSIADYIKFNKQPYPNLFGRRKNQAYYNAHSNIIERFINKLMRGGTGKKVGGKFIRTEGRLQGKKLKVMHIVEDAFDIINKKSSRNPVQVFVDALQNAAPI